MPSEPEFRVSSIDHAIARLAERQHGCFARRQAREIGCSYKQIQRRVRAGHWRVVHTGVFRLPGGAPSPVGDIQAGVLAVPDASASHLSAAFLWRDLPAAPATVHILRQHGWSHPLDGVRLHQTRCLLPRHLTTIGSIAVTTRARTTFDLAAMLNEADLEALISRQLAARSVHPAQFEQVLRDLARPGRPGTGEFARALDRHVGVIPGASVLEQCFQRLCNERNLPCGVSEYVAPWDQHRRHPERVDVAYESQRVIIELDSRTHHTRLADFENDRRRDHLAMAAGWRTLRFTWSQVVHDADHVERILRSVLTLE